VAVLFACGKGDSKPQEKPIEIPLQDLPRPPAPAPVAGCADVTVHVAADKVMVGRGTPAPIPHANGAIDGAGVEAALRKLAAECGGAATVNGDDLVVYQDLVTAMDVAIKAGFPNIQIDVDASGPPSPPAQGSDALKTAPVIVLTAAEVQVNGAVLGPISGDVAALVANALADKSPKGPIILQADASTPVRVIKAAVAGGQKAGFDQTLFAVKNK
jgi:biopolymer transport protein ExbD